MIEIQLIEQFERYWPHLPKDKVFHAPCKEGHMVFFGTEHGPYQLLLKAIIGKRGGLAEEIIVIDTEKRVLADRLYLAEQNTFTGHLLRLDLVRSAMKDNPEKLGAVTSFMAEILERVQKHPKEYFNEGRLPRKGYVSISVATVSGGAWGQGKR
jgi:hypothetical protein